MQTFVTIEGHHLFPIENHIKGSSPVARHACRITAINFLQLPEKRNFFREVLKPDYSILEKFSEQLRNAFQTIDEASICPSSQQSDFNVQNHKV